MIEKEKILLAAEYLDKGYVYHLNGKLSSAIDLYRHSIAIHPTSKAHTFLGWAYSLQGKYEEAIEECMTAINLDPDYGNPYNDIGSYLISLGRLDEAIIWLEKALIAPNYEPRHFAYYNLGRVYEKKGDWFTALCYYNDALKQNPEYDIAKTAALRITTLLN